MAAPLLSHLSPLRALLTLVAAVAALALVTPTLALAGHFAPAGTPTGNPGIHAGWRHGQHAGESGESGTGGPPAWGRRPAPSLTYLALGDSLAFGYSRTRFEHLAPGENPEGFDTGYVDDFGGVLRIFDRNLQIVNDGCPGETTDSFIKGPCAYQLAFPLHHPYSGGPSSSQLADALAYLNAHPGTVTPITIDLGANDALALIKGACKLEAACIASGAPALFAHIASNLTLILGDLRAADPNGQIIVLGLYNPFGSTIAGGDELTAKLNETMATVAAGVGARFADPLPLFNPPGALEAPRICLLTNMCLDEDIHPTDLGYAVLAGLILRQYVLGLPPRQRGPWHGIESAHRRHGPLRRALFAASGG